jgi:hypothetical protein
MDDPIGLIGSDLLAAQPRAETYPLRGLLNEDTSTNDYRFWRGVFPVKHNNCVSEVVVELKYIFARLSTKL